MRKNTNKEEAGKPDEKSQMDEMEALKDAFTGAEGGSLEEPLEKEENSSKKAAGGYVRVFGYDVPVNVVQNIILISTIILVLLLILLTWRNARHNRAELAYLNRIMELEQVNENIQLNQSEKDAIKARIERNVVEVFDSLLVDGDMEGRLDELLTNGVISDEMKNVYSSLLLRNNLTDDEYIRVIRKGVNRDISISTSEMASILYLITTRGNLNKERFNVSYSRAGEDQPVLLVDSHRGNIWRLSNGKFEQLDVENLDAIQNDDEILGVIEDFVESTKGIMWDFRSDN